MQIKSLLSLPKRSKRKASGGSFSEVAHKIDDIDDWIISDYVLGKGAFAVVKKAWKKDEPQGEAYAARIVPLRMALLGPTIFTVEQLRRRLDWAKDHVSGYKSRHILALLDYRILAHDLVVFTELMLGGDLHARIRAGKDGHLTEDEAREATRSLCEILAEAHRKGCMHRDIKPENILLVSKEGPLSDLVLADWGQVLIKTHPWEVHHDKAGTPGYLAPEMIQGSYTMACDAYSLGISCYSMLVGRVPFLGQTAEEIAKEAVEQDIPWPKIYWQDISTEARHFVWRLTQRDARSRMTMADALKHPWLTAEPDQQLRFESLVGLGAHSDDSGLDRSSPLQSHRTSKSVYASLGDSDSA